MDKHVFVWRPPDSDIAVFARAGQGAVERRLDGIPFARATVHHTHVPPPRFGLVPYQRTPMALVSLRGSAEALDAARHALAKLPGRLEGWAVDESVPITPDPRARVTLVTLFRKRAAIDHATFLSRWHDEHTPMAVEIHRASGYVRNVVTRPLLEGSAPWDGIVTEDFVDPAAPTSLRLFGQGPRALYDALRVGRHVTTFLDLGTIQNYLTIPHVPT